jgi:hypothetical protein
MGVGSQHHVPSALPSRKEPVPIAQEAGWASGPVWTDTENFAGTGFRSLDRRACSESLYRLTCPVGLYMCVILNRI